MISRLLGSNGLRVFVAFIAAIPAGFFLLGPFGRLFDILHLPIFNTWALSHASGVIAWPMLSIVAFVIVWKIIWFLQRRMPNLPTDQKQ